MTAENGERYKGAKVMEQPKKAAVVSKRPSARKLITDKLQYIARTRGMKMNDAWESIVAPVVQAEFDACGGAPVKASAKKG